MKRFSDLKLHGKYPLTLVTHDPNMLKKVTVELIWKIKSVSSRREMAKFLGETVHTSSTWGLYIPYLSIVL